MNTNALHGISDACPGPKNPEHGVGWHAVSRVSKGLYQVLSIQ